MAKKNENTEHVKDRSLSPDWQRRFDRLKEIQEKKEKECGPIKEQFPQYVLNEVASDSREAIEKHIQECAECRMVLLAFQDAIAIVGFENPPPEGDGSPPQ